jgi:hypothetical protein
MTASDPKRTLSEPGLAAIPVMNSECCFVAMTAVTLVTLFTASACSIPQSHVLDDRVVTARCVVPSSQARVYRYVDTCPDFGGPPRPREWRLHLAADWQRILPDWWNDPPRAHTLRSCYPRGATETLEVVKLSIENIKTQWDFENGDRMWITGRATTADGEVPFVYEKSYTTKPTVEDEIRRMFASCTS